MTLLFSDVQRLITNIIYNKIIVILDQISQFWLLVSIFYNLTENFAGDF